MSFQKINMKSWERKNEFFVFTKIMPSYFSLTVDIDITETFYKIKEKKMKIFPSTLYIVDKVVNSVPEFKLGYENNELVSYDNIYPMFPYFHNSTNSCSVLWLPVNENFTEFHKMYINYIEKYGSVTFYGGTLDKPTPRNIYNISMEHRIHFSSLSMMPVGDPKKPLLNPIIVCGKFMEKKGRIIMPVSFTLHHAVGDGYHASQFFDGIQKMYSAPEEWIDK